MNENPLTVHEVVNLTGIPNTIKSIVAMIFSFLY